MDETTGYTISLLCEEDMGDELTGYEVQVPVKSDDHYDFKRAAKKLLFRVEPQPLVYLGDDLIEWDAIEYTLIGDGWKLHKGDGYHYGGQGMALMGGVAYPIHANNLDHDYQQLLKAPIDHEFEIGDLDIVPSREGLKYTDKTKAALYAKHDDVTAQLEGVLEDKLKDCTTEWERMIVTNKVSGDLFKVLKVGKEVVDSEGDVLQIVSNYSETQHKARYLSRGNKIRPTDQTIMVVNDEPSKRVEKINHYIKENGLHVDKYNSKTQMYMVNKRKDDDGECQAVLDRLGNPPVLYVSDLPRDPDVVATQLLNKGKNTTSRLVPKLKRLDKGGNLHDADNYDTSKGGVYINIRNNQPHECEYTYWQIRELMKVFNVTVYCLPGSVSEAKFLKSGRWCKFDTYINKLMDARVKGIDMATIRRYYIETEREKVEYNNRSILSLLRDYYPSLNIKNKQYLTNSTSMVDKNVIDMLVQRGRLRLPNIKYDYGIEKMVTALKEKHPVLKMYEELYTPREHIKTVIQYVNQGELT